MNRDSLRLVSSDGHHDLNALMPRVIRGDEHAFAQLYDELAPAVYGIVLRVVRDRALADEVAQEAFVDLWRLATRFDSARGNVRSWAMTLAHRKAVDRVRSEQARRDREDRDHQRSPVDTGDAVTAVVEQASDRTRVRDALERLTPKQREAITLAFYGGRTYHEVAALLDVPEGTIKTRIRDGLIKLRDSMGRTP